MKARLLLGLLAGFFLVSVPSAWAQEKSFPKTEFKGGEKEEFRKYVDGMESIPDDEKTKELLGKAADIYILRLHWPGADQETRKNTLADLENEVVKKVLKLKATARLHFNKRVTPLLVERLKRFFDKPYIEEYPPVGLYAAQMLPLLARLKHESIDTLVTDLLKDEKQHLAVRMYAAKAAKELFPVTFQNPIADKLAFEQESKRVVALCQFIEGDWSKGKTDDKGKVIGLKVDDEVVRFIRRESLASLAEVGFPAVATPKVPLSKGGTFPEAEGTAVPTLLRVLAKGNLNPAPSLMEKYQAAVGICKLNVSQVPEYLPEPGVYLIGEFLIELVDGYNTEVTALEGKKPVASVPWKVYAGSLKSHLAELVANTKEHPTAGKAAARLMTAAEPLLPFLQKYQPVPGELRANLFAVVGELRPKTTDPQLFKTVKSRTVKLAP